MERYIPPKAQEGAEDRVRKTFETYKRYFPLTDEDLGKPLLDVGTGRGDFVHYIREVLGNKRAYGVENNLARIDTSKDGVVAGSGLELPFGDETFEIVTAKDYLPMFVDDKEEMHKAIMEILRVTKRGGKAMGNIATPEEELQGLEEEESPKTRAWLERRYHGAVDLQNFLKELKEDGYGVEFTEGLKGACVVMITKPLAEGSLQISANKKEKSAGKKEQILHEAIEGFKNVGDRLGMKIDRNMLECVALLNLLEMHTAGSCGGHIESGEKERISFPYLYFTAPNMPIHRFEREQEIRKTLAKKYDIKPDDVLRINEEIDREFYKAVAEDGYRETDEWKGWMLKNEELKGKVANILDEFNAGKDMFGDIHLQFARIHPGFRIEAIKRDREEMLKKDKEHKELAKEKVLEAQKEMVEFTAFLKEKYFLREKKNNV